MNPEVRVLTVKQPWAHLIVSGQKDVENRTRNVGGTYRGLVAIHAGLLIDVPETLPAVARAYRLSKLPRGVIVGLVDLVDVVTDSTSPWAERGATHLVLENPRELVRPIPFRGALGLRKLELDIADQLLQAEMR